MNFNNFRDAIEKQFNSMAKNGKLFIVDADKQEVYNKYLDSFPDGTNEIYKERREHDCNICKNFIRDVGNVVLINSDLTIATIWDIPQLNEEYDVVAKALSEHIKSKPVKNIFLHNEHTSGREQSSQLLENGQVKNWGHFSCTIPSESYTRDRDTIWSKYTSQYQMLKRSLDELTIESAETVVDLISSNSLYRGKEHERKVLDFIALKTEYDKSSNKENFLWLKVSTGSYGIRNSAIGSLLTSLSDGMDIETAVSKFEAMVAPSNYKRSSKVVTKGMMEKAIKEIDEKGIRDSLPRRHAVSSDLSINDIIFTSGKVQLKDKDPLLAMVDTKQGISIKSTENATEITMEEFINSVVPNTSKLQLLTTRNMDRNKLFMSAPVDPDAPDLMSWGNNFAWSYDGNTTDSDMTRMVEAKGGRTDGVVRFTHSWNHNNDNDSLMDLHVFLPGCNHPSMKMHDTYGDNLLRVGWNKRKNNRYKGSQDVDYIGTAPNGYVPVENITFQDLSKLPEGQYEFKIHNWSKRGKYRGFKAEISILGELYEYEYTENMENKEWVTVATAELRNGQFTMNHVLKPINDSTNNELVDVNMMMYSPNHWDNSNHTGNKHYIFTTDTVKPETNFRGFYSEYLRKDLHDIRKQLDMIASKMMCEPNENGISGYGFSETIKTDIVVKADNRLYKIKL